MSIGDAQKALNAPADHSLDEIYSKAADDHLTSQAETVTRR